MERVYRNGDAGDFYQVYGSGQATEFHVRKNLTGDCSVKYLEPQIVVLNEMPENLKAFIQRLGKISGITSIVAIYKHELRLYKSPCYTWEEIAQDVWKLIDGFLEQKRTVDDLNKLLAPQDEKSIFIIVEEQQFPELPDVKPLEEEEEEEEACEGKTPRFEQGFYFSEIIDEDEEDEEPPTIK